MIINDNRKGKTVPFATIKRGEIFTDDDDFMLKTEEVVDATLGAFNAVNLKGGEMYYFNDDAEVIRINQASLTIYE